MKIEPREITIRELVKDYSDDGESGVTGYGGKLDIRPKYQREFVYKDAQRDAVIDTVIKGYPLNVMYWAVRDDGTFEVIDGQQRTISVGQYVNGDFSFNDRFFENLQSDEREKILDYELMIYLCEGADSEKLEWFKTINIAGEELTNQELRNAVYAGFWTSDAKKRFSKNGCVAQKAGSDYLKGSAIRQDYLETAIKWINDGKIEEYMAQHQHDPNADALWNYFRSVIDWVEATFKTKRTAIMQGVDWGSLYNQFKDEKLDSDEIEAEVAKLIADEDVTNQRGICPYILTHDEKCLSIRAFPVSMKQRVYERQGGTCARCGKSSDIQGMEADHITPWVEGGRTDEANCQMLCKKCNRTKSSI